MLNSSECEHLELEQALVLYFEDRGNSLGVVGSG